MKQLGDKERIWLSHELAERDEIAAFAAKDISSSEFPQARIKIHMPKLMKYEILPNIIWDRETDDEIRRFALEKISPPRRLSQPARIEYFNKFPRLTVHQCIMVLINVEPGTMVRTQAETERYVEVLKLAQSYADAHQEPFSDGCDTKPFFNYKIDPEKFYSFTEENGHSIPEGWVLKARVKNKPKAGSLKWHVYNEAVDACIAMIKAENSPTQLTNELVTYIRSHPDTFEHCNRVKTDSTLLRYIRGTGNPMDDDRCIEVLNSRNSAQKQ